MEQKILNYIVVLEPDTRTGTNEPCYSVFCPSLGLSDSGDTIEEAIENMKKLIVFHLESLHNEQELAPAAIDKQPIISTVQIVYPY